MVLLSIRLGTPESKVIRSYLQLGMDPCLHRGRCWGSLSSRMRAEHEFLKSSLPRDGLFRDKSWRLSPHPVALSSDQIGQLQGIGRALHAFAQAANRLYFDERTAPVFRNYLDSGKPDWVLEMQRATALREQVPALIRPDLLLTENGFRLVEIDSLPGGIGTLDFLHETYTEAGFKLVRTGSSFGEFFARRGTCFVFSEEGMDYEPEMRWLVGRSDGRTRICLEHEIVPDALGGGGELYRYFELWDPELTPQHRRLLEMAAAGEVAMTPPPKAFLEEKLLLALYWLPGLRRHWLRELNEAHVRVLDELIPMSWILDPTPIPNSAVRHHTRIWDWKELKDLSQKERQLVIKISGFSEKAWGSRGVYIGHDLAHDEWEESVDAALQAYEHHPHLLQPFENSLKFEHEYYREDASIETLESVARFNPYYQIDGQAVEIASVMAVVCPSDKKKIHGMNDASLVPCV